jgi:hypothetical protein
VAEQHVECRRALFWSGHCTFGKRGLCLAVHSMQALSVAKQLHDKP